VLSADELTRQSKAPTTRSDGGRHQFKLGHRPSLGGLRAIAVLGVFFSHAHIPFGGDGLLGVDLFFVLSGFLITTLLIEEHREHGHVRLGAFFVRRARRLLPAFVVFAIASLVMVYPFLNSARRSELLSSMFTSVFYVRNWHQIATGSGLDGYTMPHLWSLAVEEQFYLVWPLVFSFVWKRWRPARVAIGVGVAIVISTLLSFLWLSAKTDRTHIQQGTDTRAAQLLIGVLVAIVVSEGLLTFRIRRHVDFGLLGIVCTLLFFGGAVIDDSVFISIYLHGGLTVVAALFGLLILALVQDQSSPANRLLSIKPLEFFGRISYAFYLWHVLVLLVVGFDKSPLSYRLIPSDSFGVQVIAAFALSTLAAWLSTVFVEKPCMSMFAWANQKKATTADKRADQELRMRPRLTV
jgi:peptidoglycan/LPS O-acetylase OafA/YrhL